MLSSGLGQRTGLNRYYPAGPWVMLLFWLVVVALAMAYWLFA
jgi:hypothetical protein